MNKISSQQFIARARRLPGGALWAFAIRQAWAALFGGLLLVGIIVSTYIHLPWLPRYDWLFLYAIAIQIGMLATKLERPHEIITILLFHAVGLGMELFKTSAQVNAWSYPGDAFFKLGNVPLFSGFMYAAVGSYIARSWRVMRLSFKPYPPRLLTIIFAMAVYINFFTDHYGFDYRVVLFGALVMLYGRTWVSYTINIKQRRMPILVSLLLVALFIWLAENISTFTRIWLYPTQVAQWHIVGITKLGSWILLLVISFVMIDSLHYLRIRRTSYTSKDHAKTDA